MVKIAMLWAFFMMITGVSVAAGEFALILETDSGFYERKEELAEAEIDFGRGVASDSVRLTCEEGSEVPFYFVPGEGNAGTLYWIIPEMDALSVSVYKLVFSGGEWEDKPFGSGEVAEVARQRTNLIENPSFEVYEPKEVSQAGRVVNHPGWRLDRYNYRYRGMEGLKSTVEITEEEAYDGDRSLKIISEQKDVDGKETFIHGFASSAENIPLEAGKTYSFGFSFKVIERTIDGGAINAEVQFLDEDGSRIFPRDYSVNRLIVAYITTRHPEEDYLNKWITVEGQRVVPEGTAYGRVRVAPFLFAGTVYYDDLVLREVVSDSPVDVKVGEIRGAGR